MLLHPALLHESLTTPRRPEVRDLHEPAVFIAYSKLLSTPSLEQRVSCASTWHQQSVWHHRSLLRLQGTCDSEHLILQSSTLAKYFTHTQKKSIKSNSQIFKTKQWKPAQSSLRSNSTELPTATRSSGTEQTHSAPCPELKQFSASTLTAAFRWCHSCWHCFKKGGESYLP